MGVKQLGYVVIETRDPAAWRGFLTGVAGVMAAGRSASGADLYRIDDRVFRFWVQKGEAERFVAAGLAMANEAAFEAALAAVAAAGRPLERASAEEAAARGAQAVARTTDPAANGLELYWGDATTDAPFISPAGVSGFVTGALGMGHAVLAAPNFEATHRFYRDALGMGDTDLPRFHLAGPDGPSMSFAFMHGDNGRHHSIALGEMAQPPSGCIHIMLEAKTLEDVGRAYDRVRLAKVPVSASLGRHVNDEMTSFYMQTPGGFDLEFGCGGLVIDPKTWKTTAHDKISDWGHVWAWQTAMEAEQA